MSIHTAGPLAPTPDDLRITHRGRDIALKFVDWGVSTPFLVVIERDGAAWNGLWIVRHFDDRNDGAPGMEFEREIAEDGSVSEWIRRRLVPEINAVLAQMFPPSTPAPDPGAEFPATLAGVDAGLRAALKWAPQPDGTLKVTT